MIDTATEVWRTKVCRQARLEDLADIKSLDDAVFADKPYPYFVVRQLFDVHGEHCVVAEADGAIHGYALVAFEPSRSTAWLLSLAVLPDSRKRGYGRALMDEAIEICQNADIKRMKITVRPTNDDAYRLYERLGFRPVGTDEAYFGADEARDVLCLQIKH